MGHQAWIGGGLLSCRLVVAAACSGTADDFDTAGPGAIDPNAPAVLIGAGDVAACYSEGDEATARLLDSFPTATIFTAGDNAYNYGTAGEFRDCYGPSWGRHKDRTRPTPGNHDYRAWRALGYYRYFGRNAGPPGKGYYSYNLGDWHIIALNSNVSMEARSAQELWLRADLAANPRACTLAYWHHPRFSSGEHGNSTRTQPVWQALYAAGADVVIGGHDHDYERFARQTPEGRADSIRGIRQFVVGTGGESHDGLGARKPNSEAFDSTSFGVLKLTLLPTSYTWEFVPAAGGSFRDSGSDECH